MNDNLLDNSGELWHSSLNCSLKLRDVLHRGVLGGVVNCKVVDRDGNFHVRRLDIRRLVGNEVPNIRFVDSVLESVKHGNEKCNYRGVMFKSLRMDDVLQYQLQKYMLEENQHEYKVVVTNIDSHSDAYAAKVIRPGDVLVSVNDEPTPKDFKHFMELISGHDQDTPVRLTFENNKIIII